MTIPRQLYADWHRCFIFHKLSLEAIREGRGSPVWLSNNRISAVASSSIDRSTVDLDRGEMGFALFDYSPSLDSLLKREVPAGAKLDDMQALLGSAAFPEYLKRFILRTAFPTIEKAVSIHMPASIMGYGDADHERIERKKGLMGRSQINSSDNAVHHLRVYTNDSGKGRLYYKHSGSIQFTKNQK